MSGLFLGHKYTHITIVSEVLSPLLVTEPSFLNSNYYVTIEDIQVGTCQQTHIRPWKAASKKPKGERWTQQARGILPPCSMIRRVSLQEKNRTTRLLAKATIRSMKRCRLTCTSRSRRLELTHTAAIPDQRNATGVPRLQSRPNAILPELRWQPDREALIYLNYVKGRNGRALRCFCITSGCGGEIRHTTTVKERTSRVRYNWRNAMLRTLSAALRYREHRRL